MELLIFAVDALMPDIVFKNIDRYPNIKKLCESGIYGDYDAYAYGYGSRDNWISLYTGLTPKEHGTVGNRYLDTGRIPSILDYSDKQPFWKMLNQKNISVGLWQAVSIEPPQEINGYMIAGCPPDFTTYENVLCERDIHLKKYISGYLGDIPMPRKPEHYGYTWTELLNDKEYGEEVIGNILDERYYEEAIDYFKKELTFYKTNLPSVQKNNPVDVLFFYTTMIDQIGHFQMHDPQLKELKKVIGMLDEFIGDMIKELNPKRVMIISDHGMKSIVDFFPNTEESIQKEAFGWKDKSFWLNNGKIIAKADNLGFLSAIHALKGCFIAAGEGIKKGKLKDMRTVDFYPTLLEMFEIQIPENRSGFVLDIFTKKEYVNKNRLISKINKNVEKIAIIQNIEVSEFNRAINEVFLSHRFSDITVIGEEKYKNIFLGNPRVNNFCSMENYKISKKTFAEYDRIFTVYRNQLTNSVQYIEIS